VRAVVQRVAEARVLVDGAVVGAIAKGLCVFAGALDGDDSGDAEFMARKLASLRIFHDDDGKMNRSVLDVGGAILLVSQFTLAADTTSGTRPSFSTAMEPAGAERLLNELVSLLSGRNIQVETGRFGAVMTVEIVNQGPVTIIIDSRNRQRK
jgi:D-tyrosyl-tRNA(Tyr) deacylase